jgi:hypothetical protein
MRIKACEEDIRALAQRVEALETQLRREREARALSAMQFGEMITRNREVIDRLAKEIVTMRTTADGAALDADELRGMVLGEPMQRQAGGAR